MSMQGRRLQKRLTRVMQTAGPPVAMLDTQQSHLFRESFNGHSVGQETGLQDK